MQVQYWRFSSEEQAVLALKAAQVIPKGSPQAFVGSLYWAGILYYGGKFDFAASCLEKPPLQHSGYHVNYLGPLVPELVRYRVFPKSPIHGFA